MLFNSTFYQKYCNTLLKPTQVHAIPDVPKKDYPKNVSCPITTLELESKTLDMHLVSLRAISMYT
jgi:hypothetical protein